MIKRPATIPTRLIAPCGMNCRLCRAYTRDVNTCPGCRGDDSLKPTYCVTCKIITCEYVTSGQAKYCYQCDRYPCPRLRQLDKRYRTKYGMSMLENLETIRGKGVRAFIAEQKDRWICTSCGTILTVHKPECMVCGQTWTRRPAEEIPRPDLP